MPTIAQLLSPMFSLTEIGSLGAAQLLTLGVLNACGQYLAIRAFMTASASMLAPFSYFSIVWAVAIGALVFGTYPDGPTLLGTGVLVSAGIYVWHRERVRAGVVR